MLDYSNEEKVLGIMVTNKFSFTNHHNEILSKATKQFNLLRRTCHFVNNTQKRRTPYLTLVRSLFEHGSQIWSPVGTSAITSFENFQKSCIKWIVHEQFIPYREANYLKKLTTLNILPTEYKFILSDLLLFHESIFELVPQQRTLDQVLNYPIGIRLEVVLTAKRKFYQSFSTSVQCHTGIVYLTNVEKPKIIPPLRGFKVFKVFKVLTYLWSLVENRLNMANCNLDISDREPD